MNKKYSILSIGVAMSTVAILFAIIADSNTENNAQNVLESKNSIYIPSNITKANPNILIGDEKSSWRTTNIADVADNVVYTIEGTVLKIDDPINRIVVKGTILGQGLIPVTITVDKVYKGELNSQTFTFFLTSIFLLQNDDFNSTSNLSKEDRLSKILQDTNKKHYLLSESGQFEIGEKVIVHISEGTLREPYMIDDPKNLERITPDYHLTLGEYSKYRIQDNMAYNNKFSNGLSIDFVIKESQ